MRTPSGELHVVDFKTGQIIAGIQPKDYWDDMRHWEIKNNIDTLDFKVFDNTEQSATLMQQNLVLKEVRDGRVVPYVITEIEKNSDDRSVTVYASGEWILLAKVGIIKPQRIEGKTVNEFIDMALAGTKWKRGRTEYAGFHTMTIDEFIDPLKFLKDIASLFELEIVYRAEVVGSRIVGRYVDMVKKRGNETGKEITLGKDLMGIKRIENSQNICTALVGFVKGEDDKFITVESINNGLPYIVDPDAFQRWNERGQHKFGFYTPETEQDITPQRLLTLMKTELKKRVNTSVSYQVDAQSIGRVFGLAHEMINEGDTLYIKDTGFTPKLYLEARAIAGDESITDPSQDKYTFGDYREIVDANEELRKMYNRILATLGSKANKELLDQLEKLVNENNQKVETAQKESEAAKQLAEQVQENLKNYQTTINESKTPPTTGLEPGKTLWLDISNGKPGILKKWNGTEWEALIPDYGEDVKELDERTADIQTSVKGLTSTVDQLSITTTEHGKQITDAHTKIEQTSQAIEAKVDIKQVEDYVGGIGPINLIRNSRFTQGTKYFSSAVPFFVDINETHWGDSSLKLSVSGNTANAYRNITADRIPVSPGENVVVSAYFKIKNLEEHLNQKMRMVAVFWKADGTQLEAGIHDFTMPADTWTRQEFTKVAPPEADKVALRAYVIRNGTFWMAHPMLQKGTKASSFIENPNDMVDKDKIMDELADKIATEDYNQKVTDIERRITANEKGISLAATKEETYTKIEADGTFATDAYVKTMEGRIEVTENNILNTVKKGEVISSINQTAEAVKIKAEKIELDGNTVAKSLEAHELSGVTIKTAKSDRYVEMKEQYVKLIDQNTPRSFWGFWKRRDGYLQPTFILGTDTDSNTNASGSFMIYNIMDPNNMNTAVGTIGMVENSDPTNLYTNARINFYRNSGQIQTNSKGTHFFQSDIGEFYFHNSNTNLTNVASITRKGDDSDLNLSYFTIRGSAAAGYDKELQIKYRGLNSFAPVKASGFLNTSLAKYKSYIKDLTFSPLEKVLEANVKEYYLKTDIADLYEIRENDPDNLHTIKEIRKNVGLIADDADEIFTGEKHETIDVYTMSSVTMAALKEHVLAQNEVNNRLTEENKQLNEKITTLETRVTVLEELVQKLINDKNEPQEPETPTTEGPEGAAEGGTTEQTEPTEQQ
ncbi:phage tail spike protein [Bacillus sp. XF8]|uniref:phage tail spike protein n=1 Tax=Bacillus sp. XF8 TaxID=2819289 RepID=UPI001AA09CFC|nr:phage tail spike protein [Bacillus sp. XF8]MBO1582724.1 phage tail protein [Bacillus sp. XF8]